MSLDCLGSLYTFFGPVEAGIIVAAGIASSIYGFFRTIEGILKEQTKKEVAAWLTSANKPENSVHWSDTFAKIFDSVFGKRHLSLRCFARSCLMTIVVAVLLMVCYFVPHIGVRTPDFVVVSGSFFLLMILANFIPDYLSLLKSRLLLQFFRQLSMTYVWPLLLLDGVVCLMCGYVGALIGIGLFDLLHWQFPGTFPLRFVMMRTSLKVYGIGMAYPHEDGGWDIDFGIENDFAPYIRMMSVVPAFFALFWTTGYLVTGFLIRGSLWFVSRVDTDNKPLQIIGAIFGIICALIYFVIKMGYDFIFPELH